MKAIIVTFQNDMALLGPRSLAAQSAKAGNECLILSIPATAHRCVKSARIAAAVQWIREQRPGLVGISLMTAQATAAERLTEQLRRCQIPVAWGGVHPTAAPHACAGRADFIVRGPGERPWTALLQAFAAAGPATAAQPELPAPWTYEAGAHIWPGDSDEVAPWPEPEPPDLSCQGKYLLTGSAVTPLTPALRARFQPYSIGLHYLRTGRNCPYRCSYCAYDAGRGCVKPSRTISAVIAEARLAITEFPQLLGFTFVDESFLARSRAWLDEFCATYRERVGLPFFAELDPRAIDARRLSSLLAAGLTGAQVGIQSANSRICAGMYNRQISRRQLDRSMALLRAGQRRLRYYWFDVIVGNPYETPEERLNTIRYLSYPPRGSHINLFQLAVFPGTELAKQVACGALSVAQEAISGEFAAHQPSAENRLFSLLPTLPRWLTRRLTAAPLSGQRSAVVHALYVLLRAVPRRAGGPLTRPVWWFLLLRPAIPRSWRWWLFTRLLG